MIEIWKIIEDAPKYSISNLGNVRCNKNGKRRKTFVNMNGYLQILLPSIDGKIHSYKLHRLIGKAFIPNPDNKPQINHQDLNRLNNSIENLEWVTNRENVRHSYLKKGKIIKMDEKYKKRKINITIGKIIELYQSNSSLSLKEFIREILGSDMEMIFIKNLT